jgi:hypothetical protein
MRRVQPSVHGFIAAAVAAMVLLATRADRGSAQARERPDGVRPLPDTLPRFEQIVATSDSSALVRAANDALQGKMGVEVPMSVTSYRREGRSVVIALRPQPTPGVVWRNLAGSVRILEDGRRIILSRD